MATATIATEGGYAVDTVHSSVLFSVKHNNVSNFYGRFNKIDGTFNVENQQQRAGSLVDAVN